MYAQKCDSIRQTELLHEKVTYFGSGYLACYLLLMYIITYKSFSITMSVLTCQFVLPFIKIGHLSMLHCLYRCSLKTSNSFFCLS
uniref:Uncharacterized protein n=1 Tax=Arundo donax TaxID=35708 RepID=A0A0A9E2W8_ARUDO